MQTIVLAGGCFWCTEAVFQRLKGVEKVVSGYANANTDRPSYDQVASGTTNAAEAIEITFDPQQISLEQLLEVFWATHDPTTLNRQGADTGSQYRSGIYYRDDNQRHIAEKSLKLAQKNLPQNIVTEIKPLESFTNAEDYHQNFYNTYKNVNPYCTIVIEPKIAKLIEKFNSQVKEEYR